VVDPFDSAEDWQRRQLGDPGKRQTRLTTTRFCGSARGSRATVLDNGINPDGSVRSGTGAGFGNNFCGTRQ